MRRLALFLCLLVGLPLVPLGAMTVLERGPTSAAFIVVDGGGVWHRSEGDGPYWILASYKGRRDDRHWHGHLDHPDTGVGTYYYGGSHDGEYRSYSSGGDCCWRDCGCGGGED